MIKLARKLENLARLESWNSKLETGPQAGSYKLEVAGQLEPQAGNCIRAGKLQPAKKNFFAG